MAYCIVKDKSFLTVSLTSNEDAKSFSQSKISKKLRPHLYIRFKVKLKKKKEKKKEVRLKPGNELQPSFFVFSGFIGLKPLSSTLPR